MQAQIISFAVRSFRYGAAERYAWRNCSVLEERACRYGLAANALTVSERFDDVARLSSRSFQQNSMP